MQLSLTLITGRMFLWPLRHSIECLIPATTCYIDVLTRHTKIMQLRQTVSKTLCQCQEGPDRPEWLGCALSRRCCVVPLQQDSGSGPDSFPYALAFGPGRTRWVGGTYPRFQFRCAHPQRCPHACPKAGSEPGDGLSLLTCGLHVRAARSDLLHERGVEEIQALGVSWFTVKCLQTLA